MEACRKTAGPRPAIEGRQPPRVAIEDTKVPIRGLRALSALKFGGALALSPLVGPAQGAYLAYFAYFYRRRSKGGCLGMLKPVVPSCANGPAKQLAEKLGRAMKGVPGAAKAGPVYNHLRTGLSP